ncbi:hypothetical protein os1_21770 [Comamonadaceae bacterium OS-1]|nr:hypothetical protein os1_21770 [Comamonadaceae bacterium OS-1]
MFDKLLQPLAQRWLAHPPSVWGKLPSHGDYVRHRVTPAQAQAWQQWVRQVWHLRPEAISLPKPRASRKRAPSAAGWISLEPRQDTVDLGAVPVAFVMLPGTLPFAATHYVQGVIVASEDQVGRSCPLIMYQQVSSRWMSKMWATPAGQRASSGQDLLYGLSRLGARLHASDKDWSDLVHAVDGLWDLYQPGWPQLWGGPPMAVASAAQRRWLDGYCAAEELDTARQLHGVQHLPWVNWPARLLRAEQPVPAFWQQDMRGGYINASESLLKLWGVRP